MGDALPKALGPKCDDLVGDVVAGSGHFIPEEAPEELSNRLLDLLERRAGA